MATQSTPGGPPRREGPNRRVLLVEDEPMLSELMHEMLAALGCEVVATAAKIDPALRLAGEAPFDLAILDVNLAGERIDPVADAVVARGLPVLFVTGYGDSFDARRWTGPVLGKPFRIAELRAAIETAVSGSEPGGSTG